MKTLLTVAIAATFLLLIGGCGDHGDCSLMGCQDQIELTFEDPDGEPVEGFSGEITADGETISISCNAEGIGSGQKYTCMRPGVVWVELSGVDELSANVQDADESTTLAYIGGIAVTYSTVQPNGPDCPPTCQQANETVTMEPTQSTGG